MRILTWNLRYDAQPDNISIDASLGSLPDPLAYPPFMARTGELPWSLRRIPVAQHILDQGVVVAALQEALKRQVDDLQELLGPNWAWVGVGRDDGQARGEFNPIFYNKDRLTLDSFETFWLSETPFKPSRYPDAGSYRIATVTQFSPVRPEDGEISAFTLINTHLDERSERQRVLGASLILARARYEAAIPNPTSNPRPVFVVGDFNSEQSGNDSGAYRVLTGSLAPVSLPTDFKDKYTVPPDQLPDFIMQDLRAVTPRFAVSGFFRTFTGFNKPLGEGKFGRIDYVLGGNNRGWTPVGYSTGTTVFDDGMLLSDHRPVSISVGLGAL